MPHHRHFVGFFNVPVEAPTWANLFAVILFLNTVQFSPLLKRAWGYGRPILVLCTPQGPNGVKRLVSVEVLDVMKIKELYFMLMCNGMGTIDQISSSVRLYYVPSHI